MIKTLLAVLSLAVVCSAQTKNANSYLWEQPQTFNSVKAQNFDIMNGYWFASELANDTSTGTVLNKLVKLNGASPSAAVITSTTDTSGILGIAVGGAGTSGSVQIASSPGTASCVFDGGTTAGDYVTNSPTVGGDCHDAGSNLPSSGTIVGKVLSTNASAGTYALTMLVDSNTGLTSINGNTGNAQVITTGNSGSDVNVVDSGSTHTINIPDAGSTSRGAVTTGTQTFAGNKTFNGSVAANGLSSSGSGESNVFENNNSSLCTVSSSGQGKLCTDQNRVRVSANGRPLLPIIDKLPERRESLVIPSGGSGSASFNAVGEGATAVASSNSSTLPTDTAPFLWNEITSTSSGNVASLAGNSAAWRTGKNIYWTEVDALSSTSSVRMWLGLTTAASSGNIANVAASDSLISATGGPFRGAAFRYSTGASDTNFMCVTSDGTTQNTTSSGVAADTNAHIFELREDNVSGEEWRFYIDHNLVCTVSANLPSSGGNNNMEYMRSATTLTTSAVTFGFGGLRLSEDIP